MISWKKRSLIKGYLHYWLHAVNEHSLQAPFIYRLYCEVIRDNASLSSFEAIETLRKTLLHCDDHVLMQDLGATSHVSSQPQRTIKSIARHSLSSPKFSRLLYRLLSFQKSDYIVELGTSLGINTLYLSSARPTAQVYTLEGVSAIADRAEQLFCDHGHSNIRLVRGNIDRTLPELIAQLPRIDLVYLDANHRYKPTLRYFEQLVTKIHSDSIMVIDDIYWSDEMRQAWSYIKLHPSVSLSIDIYDAGIVLFLPLAVRQAYTLRF